MREELTETKEMKQIASSAGLDLWDLIHSEQEVLTLVEPFSILYLFSQTGNLKKRPYLKLSMV